MVIGCQTTVTGLDRKNKWKTRGYRTVNQGDGIVSGFDDGNHQFARENRIMNVRI